MDETFQSTIYAWTILLDTISLDLLPPYRMRHSVYAISVNRDGQK